MLWRINGYSAKGDCPSASFKVYPGQAFTAGAEDLGCRTAGNLFDETTDLIRTHNPSNELLAVCSCYQYTLFHLLRLRLPDHETVPA